MDSHSSRPKIVRIFLTKIIMDNKCKQTDSLQCKVTNIMCNNNRTSTPTKTKTTYNTPRTDSLQRKVTHNLCKDIRTSIPLQPRTHNTAQTISQFLVNIVGSSSKMNHPQLMFPSCILLEETHQKRTKTSAKFASA